MVSHIAVIFAESDAGIDGSFTGGDRHVGGICDQYGAFHQEFLGFRVDQFSELLQDFGHFIAAFTAADIDNDIGVAPFCQLMLRHRLSGAESSGNSRRTAFGNREQRIDDALAGNQGTVDRYPFVHRARDPDRPALAERKFMNRAFGVLDFDNGVVQPVFAVFYGGNHFTAHVGRKHALMRDQGGFGAGGINAACGDGFARLHAYGDIPELFFIQSGNIDAFSDKGTAFFLDLPEGPFNAVEYIFNDPGAEQNGHRVSRAVYRFAGL